MMRALRVGPRRLIAAPFFRHMALVYAAVVALLIIGVPPATAGDWTWIGEFAGTGPDHAVTTQYWDGPVYRGNLTVSVTNTGTEPWGDFHFQIYDPIGGQDISAIDFLDASHGGEDPTSSQSSLTWIADNDAIGARIDLFFCSDPVMPGETALFSVYIANPDEVSFYGVMLYPTPVPPNAVCCAPDGSCTLVCVHDCVPPSVWYEGLTSCDPNPCLPPSPTESTTWGTIKATYR